VAIIGVLAESDRSGEVSALAAGGRMTLPPTRLRRVGACSLGS
jgi:hypothetical protein